MNPADDRDEYSLNPSLLIYVTTIEEKRAWVAETSCSLPPVIILEPLLLWALSVLPSTFSKSHAFALWGEQEEAAGCLEDIWGTLVVEQLLVSARDTSLPMQRAKLWAKYQWQEAFSYHEATRNFPFVQMNVAGFEQDALRMREYRDIQAPPPSYHSVDADQRVKLHDFDQNTDTRLFASLLKEEERRGLPGISLILSYCAGARATFPIENQGVFLHKSVPSGGARHPTEVYIAAFDGGQIDTGLYHYNVEHHSLDLIVSGDYYEMLRTCTFDLFDKFSTKPFALCLFTSNVERAMWRYRDDRSARAPMIDLGHVLMAFRTAVGALGLSTYTFQKFRDSQILSMFQIDKFCQPGFYIGTIV